MDEFLSAAIGFPAVIFGAALVVIVCFWLLVLVGAAGHDSFDTDLDTGPVGLGGVPVAVSVSLLIVFAWFGSLTGTVLLRQSDTGSATRAVLAVAVLAGSLLLAWGAVRLLVHRFRRFFPAEPPPSRLDFVGSVCTIRTGTVTATFGQAEVVSRDGSTAIVQVRRTEPLPSPSRPSGPGAEDAPLVMGGTGLLYAYDEDGEFFWVASYDAALDPGPNA
ncbi:hypothetical protein ACFV1V_04945 [Streptomyces globisporus]|uniref:hypothetical protein n=1 Tax=Streptomyces TaxID=1883 RepID=UPI0005C879D4|nr:MULTISPECIES: hypothetical protein [Streptomyces]PPA41328.1 hypothetical protein BF14_017330 [Streptomyces griseus]RAN18660.1 hypothetical protein A3838_16915 [Streptomyces badius]AWL87474.1 hypothetical protein DIJ69_17320 [Streptomyces globisporus]RAN26555.1 hypothetical protein A3800_16930 [Streptomyces badius]UIZ13962.1 hypothetical protein LZ559_16920 [Streptomyces sp. R527F]